MVSAGNSHRPGICLPNDISSGAGVLSLGYLLDTKAPSAVSDDLLARAYAGFDCVRLSIPSPLFLLIYVSPKEVTLKRISTLAVFLMLSITSAYAAEKSVVLTVPGMTCPTCPVTLKKALLKEQGVSGVKVLYEKKQLVVAYDDTKTTPSDLTKATAAVGFPSTTGN